MKTLIPTQNPSGLVSTSNDGLPVTTSLAIAEGVGNSHKTVMQLVRQNLNDLNEFGNTAFEMRNSTTGAGRPTEYAILNEQQSTLLLTYMRNNDKVRAFKKALVKAFYELAHSQRGFQVPTSLPEALRLAAEQAEMLEQLEHQVEVDAPKVAFHDQVVIAEDSISVAEAAKILGTGRQRLFAYLRQIKWVTRRNEPYQAKIEAGLMDVKLAKWEHPNHGLQQSVTALITGKGLIKLRELLEMRFSLSAEGEQL